MPVPLLSPRPSADDARAYLAWLSASPFAYHIDDSPEDFLPSFPLPVVAALRWNIDQLRDAFSSEELWEMYPSETNA